MSEHNKDEMYVIREQNVYGEIENIADLSKRKLAEEEQEEDIDALIKRSIEQNKSL